MQSCCHPLLNISLPSLYEYGYESFRNSLIIHKKKRRAKRSLRNDLEVTTFSRRVVGKSARDKPERHCGGFEFTVLLRNLKELAGKAMKMCLQLLTESNKSRIDSYSCQEQYIDHIPYYLSGLSRAHLFRQPFSK